MLVKALQSEFEKIKRTWDQLCPKLESLQGHNPDPSMSDRLATLEKNRNTVKRNFEIVLTSLDGPKDQSRDARLKNSRFQYQNRNSR